MSSPRSSAPSDPDRLATLRASGLLDGEDVEALDRFTRLAARFLDAPVAFVSLVTAERQQFASQVGLPAELREEGGTPLHRSLCEHVVERREEVRLDDLAAGPSAEARGALRELGFSAFLGVPLVASDEECLGSLSVLDRSPRAWSDDDGGVLRDLASAISTRIEARIQSDRRDAAVRASRRRLEALSEGVTIHDADGQMVYANRAAGEILGVDRAELTSRAYDDPAWTILTVDGEPMPPEDLPAAKAVRHGHSVRDVQMVVDRPDARPVILSVNAVPVHGGGGDLREAIVSFRDVTEQIRAERRLRGSEERHRRIFEQNVAGIYRSRPGGEIVDCNPAFAEMFGFESPEEAVGTPGDALFYSAEERREANRKLAEAGQRESVEFRLRRRGGEPIWVLTHSVMLEDEEDGEPLIYGTMVDITERKEAQARHRRLFEQSVAAVFRSEHEPPARILECNEAFAELFGYDAPEQIEGTSAYELYPSEGARRDAMEEIGDGGREFTDAFEMRRRDGSPVWVLGETRLVDDPELGTVNEGIMFDVSQRVRARRQLRHQALHDPLTGLANRSLLADRVEQGLARSRRHGQPLGLLMIDVAHFKRINDRLGHAAGDRVLEGLARRLRDVVRDEDTVARWGGDEFVVVLAELDGVEAVPGVRNRIREAVRRPIEAGGESLKIDLSIGAVVHGDGDHSRSVRTEDPEELVRYGDLALHRAKQQPAGSFCLFDPAEEVQGAAQIRLEQGLRDAIPEGRIVPHYQPVVRLADGAVAGFEALARWRHPERGLVPPAEFIPLAEELGLIGELGRSILRQGATWAAGLPAGVGGEGPAVCFNLSGQQFEEPGLTHGVSDLLDEAGLPPARVAVEVTETSLMQAPAQIEQLQDLGVSVYVDDFGTGYSTFAYLRDLELSGLKVDRTFVEEVARSDSDAALVETMLTLGRKMELTVVAEGIETESQLDGLRELGCEYGQGFLFAEPMAEEACETWLRER